MMSGWLTHPENTVKNHRVPELVRCVECPAFCVCTVTLAVRPYWAQSINLKSITNVMIRNQLMVFNSSLIWLWFIASANWSTRNFPYYDLKSDLDLKICKFQLNLSSDFVSRSASTVNHRRSLIFNWYKLNTSRSIHISLLSSRQSQYDISTWTEENKKKEKKNQLHRLLSSGWSTKTSWHTEREREWSQADFIAFRHCVPHTAQNLVRLVH